MYELEECFQKNIKIFGYVIREDARKSLMNVKEYIKKKEENMKLLILLSKVLLYI